MSEQEFLDSINPKPEESAPSLLVYSPHVTPRLQYVCEFIFGRILGLNCSVTSDRELFVSSPLFRINYSGEITDYAFRIVPSGLLAETGYNSAPPPVKEKSGKKYFYPVPEGDLHFDVFSAVFYLTSRYEEWQSFQPDEHGRFELSESILFKHDIHLFPVADEWIEELKAKLNSFFPMLAFPERSFKSIASIDVDNLFAYKHKGLLRTVGAAFRDLIKLDTGEFGRRIKVLAGAGKDPFDVYSDIQNKCERAHVPLIFFFLLRSGNKFDRTVQNKEAFAPVISALREKGVFTGLHPSYYSQQKAEILKQETKFLSRIQNMPVHFSRQHYLRFNIKTTPHLLMENNIAADFSMGFASGAGFRAGTSFPFYYYDFSREQKRNLLLVPFCAMDGAYFVYSKTDPSKALKELKELKQRVRKVNGLFVTVFHERTFAAHLYPGYGELFAEIIKADN